MLRRMEIPIVDLSREFTESENDFIEIFKRVGRSGSYVGGKEVEDFETAFANHCSVPFSTTCGNASDGLEICLKAAGVGAGDEVITAANSFISSAGSIASLGATPVLADIRDDLNIDPDSIEEHLTNKTRAIMPVHLTGRPAEMDSIIKIAKKHNLIVIEDAAQAVGAKYKGKPVGSLGDLASFSLHPLKNLHVYGDGGVITTKSRTLHDFMQKYKNHGLRDRDMSVFWGRNSRLDAFHAAIASYKLKKIEEINTRFRAVAKIYTEELEGLLKVPLEKKTEYSVYHNYVVMSDKRDSLMEYLIRHGIGVKIRYPIPLHKQIASPKKGFAPVAERIANEMLSLPIFPTITEDEQHYIIETIRSFFR